MAAQVKQFIDTLGGMWFKGELEGKATGVFVSTGSIHGGHETTILTSLVPLIHLGMVFVGVRYSTNDQIMTTEGVGGSPYGPSTMPREQQDDVDAPIPDEQKTARSLGTRVTQVAARLRLSADELEMASTSTK
jgi:NAD(P)H dehydrogenase (quinone)